MKKLILLLIFILASNLLVFSGGTTETKNEDGMADIKNDLEEASSIHTSIDEIINILERYSEKITDSMDNRLTNKFLDDTLGNWIHGDAYFSYSTYKTYNSYENHRNIYNRYHIYEPDDNRNYNISLESFLGKVIDQRDLFISAAPEIHKDLIFGYFEFWVNRLEEDLVALKAEEETEKSNEESRLRESLRQEAEYQQQEENKLFEDAIKKRDKDKVFSEALEEWFVLLTGDIAFLEPVNGTLFFARGKKYDEKTVIIDKMLLGGEYERWGIVEFSRSNWDNKTVLLDVQIINYGSYTMSTIEGVSDFLRRLLILNDLEYSGDTIFLVSTENVKRYNKGGYNSWKLEEAAELYLIQQ